VDKGLARPSLTSMTDWAAEQVVEMAQALPHIIAAANEGLD
jgi:hypothetical protein